MNCPNQELVTDAYLSGDIENLEWRNHINCCADCAALLRSESDFDHVIKHAVNEERLQTRQLEAHVRDAIRQTSSPWNRQIFVSLRYGIAATVVFATLVIATLGYAKGRLDRNSVCVDAVDDHQEEVVGKAPRKWRSERKDVEALSLKMVGDAGVPERIAPAGYHLIGARVCLLHGKRYMHLDYSNGASEVSVFVRHRDDHATLSSRLLGLFESDSAEAQRIDSLTVGSIQRHNLSLVMVSASSIPDVQKVVEQAASHL